MSTAPRVVGAVPRHDADLDLTLERGFVASLRWLVSEGDTRGLHRVAVELRALREALAELDETRAERDGFEQRADELDRELQAALAVLGPGTAVNGNGSLVQRLARLRERLAEDTAARQQVSRERDAWRAMCTLLTHTRAQVHELLEQSERERHALTGSLEAMKQRITELCAVHDDVTRDAAASRAELAAVRSQLRMWSSTVERALRELADTSAATVRSI